MIQQSLQRNIANFLYLGRVNSAVQFHVDTQGYIYIVIGKISMNAY